MGKYYSTKFLLLELQRFYNEHARIPKSRELNNSNGYPNWISYRARFGSLKTALSQAGLPLDGFRIRPKRYESVELINLLLKYRDKYGRLPEYSDLNKRGNAVEYPHVRTYESRFGSYQNALRLAMSVESDAVHGDVTLETVVASVEKMHKESTFKIVSNANVDISSLTLSLNEINHLLKGLENIYCETCKNIRYKLLIRKKELENESS